MICFEALEVLEDFDEGTHLVGGDFKLKIYETYSHHSLVVDLVDKVHQGEETLRDEEKILNMIYIST